LRSQFVRALLEVAPNIAQRLGRCEFSRPFRPQEWGALFTQGIGLRPQPWAGVSRPVGPVGRSSDRLLVFRDRSSVQEVFLRSQSHRTAQGNSERGLGRPCRSSPIRSQSHRTAQDNSELHEHILDTTRAAMSQSHRTAQGNSEVHRFGVLRKREGQETVAIPPYCSGQFRGCAAGLGSTSPCSSRNPTVLLRAIPRVSDQRVRPYPGL
jgi:hypothetical protein